MSGGKGLSVFEVEFLSCLVWIYTFKINLLLKLQTYKQRQKHHQHKTVFKQCSSNTSLRCNFTKNMSWFTEYFSQKPGLQFIKLGHHQKHVVFAVIYFQFWKLFCFFCFFSCIVSTVCCCQDNPFILHLNFSIRKYIQQYFP